MPTGMPRHFFLQDNTVQQAFARADGVENARKEQSLLRTGHFWDVLSTF